MNKYTISGSPHVHSTENTQKIMYRVILALVPALLRMVCPPPDHRLGGGLHADRMAYPEIPHQRPLDHQ